MSTILRPIFRFSYPSFRHDLRRFQLTESKSSIVVLQKAQQRQHHVLSARCSQFLQQDSIPLLNGSGLRNISSLHLIVSQRSLSSVSLHRFQRRHFSDFHDKRAKPRDWSRIDPRRHRWSTIVAALAVLYFVYHLERVPETGRIRFMAVSEERKASVQDDEYKALLKAYEGRILPSDHPITKQIRNVISVILSANDLGTLSVVLPETLIKKAPNSEEGVWNPDSDKLEMNWSSDEPSSVDNFSGGKRRRWNLIVVDDDTVVNAMVANANIIVFTGILPVARDIDGLAAVLSHEIAHEVARHLSEKLSSTQFFDAILFILDILGLSFGFESVLVEFLYRLPNSRTMELEADKIGLQLASRACFDPRGAVSMQTRMSKLESQHSSRIDLTFLQTHPSGIQRMKFLSDSLPEAYAIRAGSSACAQLEDEFDAFRAMAESVRSEQEREVEKEENREE